MKRILILTSCFLSILSARFLPEDIQAEVSEYQKITHHANDLVQPIRMQIQEEKERIGTPLNAEIEPLRREIEALSEHRRVLYDEQNSIREQNAVVTKCLEDEKDLCLKAALTPLETELASRRTPILERVAALRAERDAIEREHYRLKADPVWGRWMDGIDSLDAGLRMGFKDQAIKDLYASVDGDLPAQIAAKRSAIEAEFYARLEDENKRYTSALQAIELRIKELSDREHFFYERIQMLERQKSAAINDAMPGKDALLRGIEDQVINALISGVPIP